MSITVANWVRRLVRPAPRPAARQPVRLAVQGLEDRTVPTTLPAGFAETQFATGLDQPTSMAFAPDGRLFVAEKEGSLRVIQPDGTLLGTPFMTVPVITAGQFSERGLLGVAFDPDFANNRFLYAYYTTGTGEFSAFNRVSRFTADAGNPNVVQAGSEVVLLDNIPSQFAFHQGGGLHFAADGTLLITVGDNGIGANAQSLTTLAGKMLRINRDGTIPADNPFVGQGGGVREEIWAYGLRNPFTFAVDPLNGRVFANDVGDEGAGSFEEVNDIVAGGNYGWDTVQGNSNNPNFINPIHAYPTGAGAAITGGVFYRANAFPAANQGYYFADFVRGFISRLDATNQVRAFATATSSPIDLDVAPDGSLMYLSLFEGTVYRIAAKPPSSLSFVDTDGDRYTVRLTGPGTLAVEMDDQGGGQGPISRITVQGTDPARSSLTVTVARARTGDGIVTIGQIDGTGLRGINARKSDLVGTGVALTGALGSLAVRDIQNGADVTAAGTAAQRTTVTANVIGNGTDIAVGSTLTRLSAASVGDGSVTAPAVGSLIVRGDFNADLTLAGTGDPKRPTTLNLANIAGGVTGSAWQVAGNAGSILVRGTADGWNLGITGAARLIRVADWPTGTLTAGSIGSLMVPGTLGADVTVTGAGVLPGRPAVRTVNVGTVANSAIQVAGSVTTFLARQFFHSSLLVGYTPNNPNDPFAGGNFLAGARLGTFRVAGVRNAVFPAFTDGFVGATAIGTAHLHAIQPDNPTPFGLLVDTEIRRLTIGTPRLSLSNVTADPALDPGTFDDFVIRVI